MELPRLRMDATYGKIGLRTQDAKLAIHQQKAKLTIRQPEAKLTIRTTPGKLNIDQSRAFAEAGLKSIFQLIDEFADSGHRKALEGIARRARQGDRLMQIENGGHAIAELGRINSSDPPLRFNIGWMPNSPFSVKFHYRPANVHIQWETHHPQIKAVPRPPQYAYTPGEVKGYMRQWPSLEIDVVGTKVDQQT
ncbi:MAG TPA: DUF6470 family protein [Bacillales bacterium]|nr:DUF6470 family protein [Bacillales bacterium]